MLEALFDTILKATQCHFTTTKCGRGGQSWTRDGGKGWQGLSMGAGQYPQLKLPQPTKTVEGVALQDHEPIFHAVVPAKRAIPESCQD